MNKNIFYYLQVLLLVLIGACGVALIIGGLCMSSFMPIALGTLSLVFILSMVVIELKGN